MTQEEKEIEAMLVMQAQQAKSWQDVISQDQDIEQWVDSGNLGFLEKRIFGEIEQEAFRTIKNPGFNPADLAQVAQLKALCQVVDLIKNKILLKAQAVRDARAKLAEFEVSTRNAGEEGR